MVLIFGRNIPDTIYYCIVEKLGRYIYIFLVLFGITLVILFVASFILKYDYNINVIYINLEDSIVHTTSEKFLSVALDSAVIANGFKNFNIRDTRVVKLMKPLAPAYLRIGGNLADRLIFTPSGDFLYKYSVQYPDGGDCSYADYSCVDMDIRNFTMSGDEWLDLNVLARKAGFEIIFDLNVLIRFDNDTWNPENAESLLEYSDYYNLTVHWELGNEPNAFNHQFNKPVQPEQLAEDFLKLKQLLNEYPRYKEALLVGPDVTRPQQDRESSMHYLTKFLASCDGVLDAITWHQYYFNGRLVKPHYYVNPEIFNVLKWEIEAVKNITAYFNLNKPIWLGETADAWDGGAEDQSNSYISTFIWLDKLGLSAKMGLDVVIRQSLAEGYYALIDRQYNPSPNWWVSVLHKKFVGPKVVNCYSASSSEVRLYCHCYKPDPKSIIVFGVNMQDSLARIRFETEEGIYSQRIESYVLTSYISLFARKIRLNGIPLKLTSDHELPDMEPQLVPSKPYVLMPSYSLAFFRLPIKHGETPCMA